MRITVGKRASEGIVEYKLRREENKTEMTVAEAVEAAVQIVRTEK